MADGQRRVPLCCLAWERQSATAAQGAPGGCNLGGEGMMMYVSKARIGKSKARIRRDFFPLHVINLKEMMHSDSWAPKRMSAESISFFKNTEL